MFALEVQATPLIVALIDPCAFGVVGVVGVGVVGVEFDELEELQAPRATIETERIRRFNMAGLLFGERAHLTLEEVTQDVTFKATWQSLNASDATVSAADGLVGAIGAGTASAWQGFEWQGAWQVPAQFGWWRKPPSSGQSRTRLSPTQSIRFLKCALSAMEALMRVDLPAPLNLEEAHFLALPYPAQCQQCLRGRIASNSRLCRFERRTSPP